MDAAYSLIKEGEPFEREIGDFLMDWLSEEDSLMVTTSGTTGIPKRLFVDRQKMIASAQLTGEFFELAHGKSGLLALPARYIAGKMMLVRALVLGLELTYVEPAASPVPYEGFFDFAALVPMQLQGSLKQLDRIGTILVGGAPLPPDLHEALAKCKARIYETYGMTETLTHVAVRRLNHVPDGRAEEVFTALPGVSFEQDDRECLVIHASHLNLKGLVTNDVVELVSETQMIWKGRYDNVINTGGVKVHPELLQNELQKALGTEVLVAGLPDEHLGTRLIAIVEGVLDSQNIEREINNIKDLNSYEKPKQWFSLPRFIRNEAGKIDRSASLKLLEP